MNENQQTSAVEAGGLAAKQPTSLRLWPGVVLVLIQAGLRLVLPLVLPDAAGYAILGSLACAVGIIVWWLFSSRAPWPERLGVLALMGVALLGTVRVVHPSIAGGMMRMMLPVLAVPVLCAALVVAVVATRRRSVGARRAAILAGVVATCGGFMVVRTGGMTGWADSDLHWRWTETPEERLLARSAAKTETTPRAERKGSEMTAVAPENARAHWPGFRGPRRDSVLRGTRIEMNWAATPPVELWRIEVGPAWSSCAVGGGLVYTQEQRGEEEIVACYNLRTGEPVWRHADATRFWESNAGPGPRGTPTLQDGRVYAFGATGVLNALDAGTGQVVWTRNAGADTKKKAPEWGFSSSPLAVGDLVVVAVTGTLAAYDRATGEPRWTGPADGKSYSSPQLVEIAGVPQIVLMSGKGATSVAPADGKVLWQHAWEGFAIVQPGQIAEGDLLISTGDRTGARRIKVSNTGGAWSVEETWTTNRLKAYFNDYVVHRGHAYGFDGGILACVDLQDGGKKWKGGRYGSGQVLLLADQDVLLVVSEQGDVALVAAKPDEFREVSRIKAVEGKTWNHPVLAGEILLVRNDREMVAYRVALQR